MFLRIYVIKQMFIVEISAICGEIAFCGKFSHKVDLLKFSDIINIDTYDSKAGVGGCVVIIAHIHRGIKEFFWKKYRIFILFHAFAEFCTQMSFGGTDAKIGF